MDDFAGESLARPVAAWIACAKAVQSSEQRRQQNVVWKIRWSGGTDPARAQIERIELESFEQIDVRQAPFQEISAAVLGQHTMLQADSTGWRPLVDAGKLRLLMVWTGTRSPNFPDVPTLKELGYPMVYDSPFGIAGPKGMDPKIVAKLHDAFKKALEDPAVITTLAKYDMVPNYKNTEDYKKFVIEVTESERKVIDSLGLAKK